MSQKKPSLETGTEKDPQGRATGAPDRPKESGGPEGPEPTRYGDWERGGKCVDF